MDALTIPSNRVAGAAVERMSQAAPPSQRDTAQQHSSGTVALAAGRTARKLSGYSAQHVS